MTSAMSRIRVEMLAIDVGDQGKGGAEFRKERSDSSARDEHIPVSDPGSRIETLELSSHGAVGQPRRFQGCP